MSGGWRWRSQTAAMARFAFDRATIVARGHGAAVSN
jgi:hypothetical protein